MSRSEEVAKRRLWGLRFQRFERSQLTVARFCALERVSVPTFYHWRKRLTKEMSRADVEGGSMDYGAATERDEGSVREGEGRGSEHAAQLVRSG
jgi:hypothetical protein